MNLLVFIFGLLYHFPLPRVGFLLKVHRLIEDRYNAGRLSTPRQDRGYHRRRVRYVYEYPEYFTNVYIFVQKRRHARTDDDDTTTAGIGLSFTQRALKLGARVVIADLKLTADAEKIVNDNKEKKACFFVHCDATRWKDLQNLIDFTAKELGDVPDVYVPCAGILEPVCITFHLYSPAFFGGLHADSLDRAV